MTPVSSRRRDRSALEHYQYVVVGAGPCGGRAAAELAGIAGPGHVCLIGGETIGPYSRPQLSKKSLTAASFSDPEALIWAQDDLVTQYLGDPAVAVDAASRTVRTASGRRIGYDRLLLATGARARELPLDVGPGAEIHYLRDAHDAAALHRNMRRAKRLLVIGGGFIGLEVAASARAVGLDVIVVEAAPRLMARVSPQAAALAVLRKFEAEGVDVVLGDAPISIEKIGASQHVLMQSGLTFTVDLVLAGIGSQPNVDLAKDAGIDVGNGILVDANGTTSDPDIFAAGDVAGRITDATGSVQRSEAWEPALDHALAAAAAMTGRSPPAARAPWVWSDQFDWNLQMVGQAGPDDMELVRGDPASDSFIIIWITQSGTISAAFSVNSGPDMAMCRRAIAFEMTTDADAVADTNVPLRHAFKPGR